MERASPGFETLLNAEFRPGKAGAKGEKGAQEGFVSQRRCGNKPSKCNIRAGKGLAKAAQGVLGPGGKCFAQVLKPS